MKKIRPKPIPLDSPLYPLPADYHSLTVEGQRLARVNAARQWMLPGTPTQLADTLVASTWFFDTYYLQPDDEADFNPLFYDSTPLTTPDFHWDLSRTWAVNRLNVCLAPRGSAKSTHMRRDMLLHLVTDHAYSYVYATSTHDNTKFTGQALKDQCYENSRINDDFSVEYDCDRLKPAHGSRAKGTEFFYLNNGSYVRCISAESRMRGLRPKRFRLDDPEYDEKASTHMATIRQYMDRLIFKIAIPMVLRGEAGIDWVGTFVTKRHYLWHAMQTVGETRDAQDERFEHWSRLYMRAARPDSTGKLVSIWPDMWPATIAEKKALGLHNRVSLEEMPSLMGQAAFNSEMLGKPGDTEDLFLKLDPAPQGRHAWWLEGTEIDKALLHPRTPCDALLCYLDKDGVVVKKPLHEALASFRFFQTVDTAYTEGPTSDRRVCTTMALAPDNILFVFDMWSDRKPDAELVRQSFNACERWKCPVIHVEVVKESFKVYQRFVSAAQTRLSENMGTSFTPAVRPLKIGTMDKTSKISTLDVRFEHALIKLPLWQRFKRPWWTRLCDQIESFNPEAENGGLAKDDEVDTVSMVLFIIKTKLRTTVEVPDLVTPDPIELLRGGDTSMCEGGPPIMFGLPLQLLDGETLNSIIKHHEEPHLATGKSKV